MTDPIQASRDIQASREETLKTYRNGFLARSTMIHDEYLSGLMEALKIPRDEAEWHLSNWMANALPSSPSALSPEAVSAAESIGQQRVVGKYTLKTKAELMAELQSRTGCSDVTAETLITYALIGRPALGADGKLHETRVNDEALADLGLDPVKSASGLGLLYNGDHMFRETGRAMKANHEFAYMFVQFATSLLGTEKMLNGEGASLIHETMKEQFRYDIYTNPLVVTEPTAPK